MKMKKKKVEGVSNELGWKKEYRDGFDVCERVVKEEQGIEEGEDE